MLKIEKNILGNVYTRNSSIASFSKNKRKTVVVLKIIAKQCSREGLQTKLCARNKIDKQVVNSQSFIATDRIEERGQPDRTRLGQIDFLMRIGRTNSERNQGFIVLNKGLLCYLLPRSRACELKYYLLISKKSFEYLVGHFAHQCAYKFYDFLHQVYF